ncbi:MAG TPA: hypothetical protein VGJ26_03600 [Pirellulales bacterium]|jgi:hypothetical protein
MRGILLGGWLLVPVLMGAYHYGPGQRRMELDETQDALSAARKSVQAKNYELAVKQFSEALAAIPSDQVAETRRIRLERAKAQLLAHDLPSAYNDLTALLAELQEDKSTDPKLVADTQQAMANAQYYLTWLMRLEGQPRDVWEPEIEGSRQLYRMLAEQATAGGEKPEATSRQEDLEAAVRLARLDLSELQALPLPSQCKNCKSGNCNCKCKGKKISQNKGQSKSDARGASSGPPPDNHGN